MSYTSPTVIGHIGLEYYDVSSFDPSAAIRLLGKIVLLTPIRALKLEKFA